MGTSKTLNMSTPEGDYTEVTTADKVKVTRRSLFIAGVLLAATILAIIIFLLLATGVIPLRSKGYEIDAERSSYGTNSAGKPVDRFLLRNKNNMELEVLTQGGTISAMRVPDRNGRTADVTLGYDSLKGFEEDRTGTYFGVLVGRVANRIANGNFTLDGVDYSLETNNGPNHLHGGSAGWHKALWDGSIEEDYIRLKHFSPDGDSGYPGNVTVDVTIRLTNENEIIINFTAQAQKKATPINLAYHPYFNLGGHDSGTIYDHNMTIFADKYLPVSDTLIPTGEEAPVNGTLFDLRHGNQLGDTIHNVSGGGYDHNFCIRGPTGKRHAARVVHEPSGRVLDVFTNQPGLQLYTGYFLNVTSGGKDGAIYQKHSGFALETQNYPDAINQPNFPDCVLRPGSLYAHQLWYKFSTV